jgi:hypothetical protein
MIFSARPLGSVIALGLIISAAGCGDSDDMDERADVSIEGTGGQASASIDPAMAQAALNQLTASVDITVTDFDGATTPAAPPAGTPPAPAETPGVRNTAAQGGVTLNCLAGGNAIVGGYVSVVPAPINVDVNAMIQYNQCSTLTGTTLNGSIEFTQSIDSGDGPGLRVETTYTGDVAMTGNLNVRCPVDLNVLVDSTGRSMAVDGTFCGRDASELNLQIMPRWMPQP